MRTNMNVGALDRRQKGETTLIQTTDPTARVRIPRTLKWSEISFPANWTLENENHTLQIQNPAQNPDLDFIQQLSDGTVRLSFDRSRLSTPLDYECRQPLDTSQFRSPINLHQPQSATFTCIFRTTASSSAEDTCKNSRLGLTTEIAD